ncbi:putative CDP-alcohol phosphatidyltransferase class-I family protein 3 [Diplonema papillatum]|nr:putative CDP-alcohol phosphatidyltransferase class-I family protein 3 [Diplonema papillatum]
MVLLSNVVVTDEALNGLVHYRYAGTDLSLTSKYILQRYWKWSVNLLPVEVAPNMITLLGLACIAASYTAVYAYCPHCTEQAPSWVWVLSGLALFSYQTLDALDGKQARRTGTSSPLGELFDHGCDAVGTVLLAMNTISSLMLAPDQMYLAVFYIIVLSGGFYFCAWEQYHTGTLTLGYVNGPVEGILTLCALFLATAVMGHDFWSTHAYNGVQLSLWLLAVPAVAGVCTFTGNIANVVRRSKGAVNSRTPPVTTIAPLVVMAACYVALSAEFPEYVQREGFRTVAICYGIAVANSCSRFVLSHICHIPNRVHPQLGLPTLGFPLAVLIFIVVPLVVPEHRAAIVARLPDYMFTYACLVSAMYLHMILSACERISNKLRIGVLFMNAEQKVHAWNLVEADKVKHAQPKDKPSRQPPAVSTRLRSKQQPH